MASTGFENITFQILTNSFQGQDLEKEISFIEERFQGIRGFLICLLGSEQKALEFHRAYIAGIREPGAVLFYNKFVVTGYKPQNDNKDGKVLRLVKSD